MSYGTQVNGNTLLPSSIPTLDLSGAKYEVPGNETAVLYSAISKLTNADLVSDDVAGLGAFNALMRGFSVFLKAEYNANRITGAEYTKAFIALSEAAMTNAAQYLLNRDQSFWQAQAAQVATITARVNLETSKYNVSNLMPAQLTLLREQIEAQRAQTLDTRVDGTAVSGTMGKQRELYNQQITSYQRDSEVKAAKMFVDGWITRKTLDEGLATPEGFANTSLDEVLTALKTNNSLG